MCHFCILASLDEDIYFLHPIAKPNDFDAKMQSLLISAHFNPGPGAEGAEEPATSSPGVLSVGQWIFTRHDVAGACPTYSKEEPQ